jgi:hypothetical protein
MFASTAMVDGGAGGYVIASGTSDAGRVDVFELEERPYMS